MKHDLSLFYFDIKEINLLPDMKVYYFVKFLNK